MENDKIKNTQFVNSEFKNNANFEKYEMAYRYLFDLSLMQNKLIWTRANVLLILQGGLLALISTNEFINISVGRIVLVLFGLLISFFSYRIILGASFWVSYVEEKMIDIEDSVFGNIVSIFRDNPHYIGSDKHKSNYKKKGYISTRSTLIYVSIFSIFLWLVLLSYFLFLFMKEI